MWSRKACSFGWRNCSHGADPVAELFLLVVGGIALAYVAGVGIVLCIAVFLVPASKPKVRALVALLGIAGAVAYPIGWLAKQEKQAAAVAQERARQRTEACSKVALQARGHVADGQLFVDLGFVDMLVGSRGAPFSSSGTADYERLLHFMLEERLEALEFDSREHLLPDGRNLGPVTRLQLERIPNPSCSTFHRWIRRYPAQDYPPLRAGGLPPGVCVGLQFADAPQSRYQVRVHETVLAQTAHGWLRQYEVALVDSRDTGPGPIASMVEVYSYGGGGNAGSHFSFPCENGATKVQAFEKFFTGTGSALLGTPALTEVAPPDRVAPADDLRRLARYDWHGAPGKDWSSNLIDSEGAAWVVSRHGVRGAGQPGATVSLEGYALTVLTGDAWLQVPIAWAGVNARNVTGLGRKDGMIAVIGLSSWDNEKADKVLFELDPRSRTARATALSPQQYAALQEQGRQEAARTEEEEREAARASKREKLRRAGS